MSQDSARIRQAEGRIRLAQERMAAKYPFHIALLSRMHVVASPPVGTMAVQAEGDQVALLHSPDYIFSISIAELVGVLVHEVLHVLFGHLSMTAKDYPNQAALTIAQEVTVNEYIVEPLPGKPVLLKDYPMLPLGESTEERYRRLKDIIPEAQSIQTLDDHQNWGDAGAAQTVRQAIEEALALAGPDNVPAELRDILTELGIGDTAGNQLERISKDRRGSVDWRTLLHRYVGQVLERRPTYARPPRRFPELVGIVPGQARQASKPKIMAVIDTSASITPELLTLIDGELRRLAKNNEVLVVECDCRIHRVYAYDRREGLRDVQGRGGTDLRPPFERAFLREHQPDLVVYMTDGCGPVPKCKPRIPVIWCLVPGGQVPTDWGRIIHMRTSDVRKMWAQY
jgi:predicted metal-dependent peptidase